MSEKAFDCMEFQHRTQVEINEQIRSMTHEQERTYFKEQAEQGPMGEWWRRVKATKIVLDSKISIDRRSPCT